MSSSTSISRILATTAAAYALMVGAAHAQTQTSETTAGLGDIIVTAQKREQSVQSIGVAVTVLSGQELTNRGITNINQLKTSTPNLEIEPAFGGGQPQFRLRGVGFDDYASNNTPTVGVYVNEVAYPIPIMTQGLLFDMQRVEVLRGPQGTLFGRNTTGGAINFITNKPTDTFEAQVSADYARFDRYQIEGVVSGPLGDNVRARLAASTTQGGAWQRNRLTGEKLGDARKGGVRGQIEFDAGETAKVLFSGHWYSDKSDGTGLYLFTPLTVSPTVTIPADASRRVTGWGSNPGFTAALGKPADAKPSRDNEGYGFSANASIDIGEIRLTSITAYEKLDRNELNDWDATQFSLSDNIYISRAKVFSQEARLSSIGQNALNWVLGVYYSNERLSDQFRSGFLDIFLFNANTRYSQKVDSISVFGQADYQINDQFKLTGGLRFEDEKRKLRDFETVGFIPIQNRDTKMSEVSGKVGIEFKATDSVLLYATASRGVKSGGFTTYNTLNVRQLAPFRPEVLWAYEVGFKSDLVENTLRLNGAFFYYDYKNQQVQSAIIDPVFGPIGQITNANKSEIYGGEMELVWQPIDGLRISQSLGYKEGKFKRFTDVDLAGSESASATGSFGTCGITAGCVEVLKSRNGQKFRFPKLSYGGEVSYGWVVQGFSVTASADYSFKDSNVPSVLVDRGDLFKVDSYWLLNTRLTFGRENGPWSVTVYGRNILNEKYDETRNFFINANVASAGQPATYGVRANFKF